MSTYAMIQDLAVQIESYGLSGRKQCVSSKFERHTTCVHLVGRGEEGVGEDVTYEAGDQLAFQRAGAGLPLAGSYTLEELSARLDGLDLFPQEPHSPGSRNYRRWAFESAALDLALRQAGVSLARYLGIEPRPVRFVVSTRLGDPPTTAPLRRLLRHDPKLQFKLDATSAWSEELIRELVSIGAVESVDLKGAYKGTIVDQPPDPALYERIVRGFDDVWIEDPALTDETEQVLAGRRHRITWDAPIHTLDDVEALPFPPRALNVKPSRSGRLRDLFAIYDYCRERDIAMYGGGQFELGPGRGQIQYLAALFHPDGPNDVAPAGYNDPEPTPDLPRSPLPPRLEPIGFRWTG
jgi:L-alanine-DL-glutamate epimerase-like enolase superfamily enzyme